jgi:hypothetical protein
VSNKKITFQVDGKNLVVGVYDSSSSRSWTVRNTHSARQKAEAFRDIAEALDPSVLTTEPTPYYPPERAQEVPQQGPIPPPLFGADEPFVTRYEPSQGLPTPVPQDRAEAESHQRLAEEAYLKAQARIAAIKGDEDRIPAGMNLPEVNSSKSQPYSGGMPQLAPASTPDGGYRPDQQVRTRPKPTDPHFYYNDTH